MKIRDNFWSGGALGWLSPPRFRPPFPRLLAHKALTFVDPFGKIDNGDPPPIIRINPLIWSRSCFYHLSRPESVAMKLPGSPVSPILGLLASVLISTHVQGQCGVSFPASETASGIVYDDLDQDGRHGAEESGVGNVSVSNGCDVVVTDSDGRYQIDLAPGQILFVSQPTGYVVPVDDNQLPLFF